MVGFFEKLGLGLKKTSDKISSGLKDIISKRKVDHSVLEDLEELLISSDLGVAASADIIQSFSSQKFDKEVSEQEIKEALSAEITKLLKPMEADFDVSSHKPYVVLMVGVNGAGKTTTIGKLGSKLKAKGLQVSFIAGDTFRAAAVEQLEAWGFRSSIHVFKGEYGCDSAGLCYDGLNAAIKRGDDVVFIDTAGRLQNKEGLMDELKKVVRVIKKVFPDAPHLTLLTLDATTGQNAVSQVEVFKKIVDVNGLVVTKLDGSSKGGILAAIAKENPTPVYFVGVGEKIEDLDVFNAEDYAKNLIGL
ncbi:MAG TPA: signal recognition particle-docking protein FtsY [Alphaproteobacteria bacterium]|nr:signal recognition particle-docking protein FtsY [Alphaproteobacteria bacterium]